MRTTVLLAMVFAASACIPKKRYDAMVGETSARATTLEGSLGERNGQVLALEAALEAERNKLAEVSEALGRETSERLTERDRLLSEQANLLKDKTFMKQRVDELNRVLQDLERRKAAADARVGEYRALLSKFKALIDAGTLRVKIVDGRMVVELPTDVLFASGSADLSETGRASVREVAKVLATLDNRYQVEGHTDTVPIKTDRFPSNWELASARALTVLRELVEGGVPVSRVSATSYGEQHPVGPNDNKEGKAANRRIEIVVVPDLSLLPGTEELERLVK